MHFSYLQQELSVLHYYSIIYTFSSQYCFIRFMSHIAKKTKQQPSLSYDEPDSKSTKHPEPRATRPLSGQFVSIRAVPETHILHPTSLCWRLSNTALLDSSWVITSPQGAYVGQELTEADNTHQTLHVSWSTEQAIYRSRWHPADRFHYPAATRTRGHFERFMVPHCRTNIFLHTFSLCY